VARKIKIVGTTISVTKNVRGLRGLRVYGTRRVVEARGGVVPMPGSWELVLDVPFKVRRGDWTWPTFELEPTGEGGFRFYYWTTYDAQGEDTESEPGARGGKHAAMAMELLESDGPESSLYEWVRVQMIRDGGWDVSREDPHDPE
jgi:hypothetical protein